MRPEKVGQHNWRNLYNVKIELMRFYSEKEFHLWLVCFFLWCLPRTSRCRQGHRMAMSSCWSSCPFLSGGHLSCSLFFWLSVVDVVKGTDAMRGKINQFIHWHAPKSIYFWMNISVNQSDFRIGNFNNIQPNISHFVLLLEKCHVVQLEYLFKIDTN